MAKLLWATTCLWSGVPSNVSKLATTNQTMEDLRIL
jgi:hypothetical protein